MEVSGDRLLVNYELFGGRPLIFPQHRISLCGSTLRKYVYLQELDMKTHHTVGLVLFLLIAQLLKAKVKTSE